MTEEVNVITIAEEAYDEIRPYLNDMTEIKEEDDYIKEIIRKACIRYGLWLLKQKS
jgi:hypothetical protein